MVVAVVVGLTVVGTGAVMAPVQVVVVCVVVRVPSRHLSRTGAITAPVQVVVCVVVGLSRHGWRDGTCSSGSSMCNMSSWDWFSDGSCPSAHTYYIILI